VAKPLNKDPKVTMDGWEAKRRGIKEKISQLGRRSLPISRKPPYAVLSMTSGTTTGTPVDLRGR